MAETFDIVDENDNLTGRASRTEVHGNPALIHRVAHVLVFNSGGELYLQRRAMDKIVQPGKWDTSVEGHVVTGEDYLLAAERETAEELGIESESSTYEFLYKYLHSNDFESEYVGSYRLIWDGTIIIQQSEIDDGRFWTIDEIHGTDKAIFTPNFLEELERYLSL
jgi:isopentenyldiphosphate isomerase